MRDIRLLPRCRWMRSLLFCILRSINWQLFTSVLGNCELVIKLRKLTVTYCIECSLKKKAKLCINPPSNAKCLKGLLKADYFSWTCVKTRLDVILGMHDFAAADNRVSGIQRESFVLTGANRRQCDINP